MATVPRIEGVTVPQSDRPLGINAPPAAFGATVAGAGLGELGRTAAQVSDTFASHAAHLAAIDNKIAADTAAIATSQEQQKYIEHYRTTNQGINAEPNLPQAYKDLEDIRTRNGSALLSPDARDTFNSQTRIATLQATQGLSSFAATEGLDVRNKTIDANIANVVRGLNDNNFGMGSAAIGAQGALKQGLNGWTKEITQAWIADKLGDASYAVTAGLAPDNPKRAETFYTAHRELMSPEQRTSAESLIRASTRNITVASVAAKYTVIGAGTNPDEVWKNIIHQESGGKPGVLGPVTSYGRAEGLTQMLPATAQAMANKLGMKWEPKRMRGTSPSDAAYQEKLGRAYFEEGLAKYGGDVAKAAAYYHGGPDERLWGPKTMAYQAAVAGQEGDRIDNLQANAPQLLAAIAADPELQGDPRLIESTQAQVMENIRRGIAAENFATGQAKERLQSAALDVGVTSAAQLQQSYPGALEDWNALKPNSQRILLNQLTAHGNAPMAVRDANFNEIQGGLGAAATSSEFAHRDLKTVDLTRTQYMKLVKMQQDVLNKAQKAAETQASIAKILNNEFVKQAIGSSGLNLGVNTPQYRQFTGAVYGEMQDWLINHPGKKPSEAEVGALAASVLAKQTVHGGLYLGNTRLGDTMVETRRFAVPEDAEKRIRAKLTVGLERAPEDWEVAAWYRREQNAR